MLFHQCPFEILSIDLHDLTFGYCKAHKGKGGFSHQAGMHPKARFALPAGMRFDHIEQSAKKAAALSAGPDKRKIDVAPAFNAHESDYSAVVAANGDVLGGEARIPFLPAAAFRNPGHALDLTIFTGPVADSVKDDVSELGAVGERCPR